jgi:hypothetical protein
MLLNNKQTSTKNITYNLLAASELVSIKGKSVASNKGPKIRPKT